MEKPLVIANYLPQYYPTEENNKWWGQGFTEWTNVARAKPLFKNHYQPKIPADLGFYDLRNPETRELQAKLAKEAGIAAFCYWHYWLGNGKTLLTKPLSEVINTKSPSFPFCLGWANHSWEKKHWDPRKSRLSKELLIEQTYGGYEDYKKHFYFNLPAFRDERYLQYNGKLIFTIFRPDLIPDFNLFKNLWNELSIKNNIPEFTFIAHIVSVKDIDKYIKEGYDYVNLSLLNEPFNIKYDKFSILKRYIKTALLNQINVVRYSKAIKYFNAEEYSQENVIPTIIPNWDHSPRSGKYGAILHNSTPSLFKKHVIQVFDKIKNKNNKIIFLKSWNEWGEGNYMEPDLKFGKQYIQTLNECLQDFNK